MNIKPGHLLLTLFVVGLSASAQVPQLLNYQGRVQVGTNDFNGSGQFKFALVNAGGNQTFWSNDGTAGNEPAVAVSLPVVKGLYSVLLGNTALPNMTFLSPQVFTNADVRLRVWFNDGTNGFQQFVPDQRIAAVGYAIMAGNVPDGTITSAKLAPGAVNSTQLANGAVTTAKLAPGAVDASKLAPGAIWRLSTPSGSISNAVQVNSVGHVGIGTNAPQQQLSVAGGMVIDQADANNSTLVSGVRFGSNSGEGIASKRTGTGNQWGLDFYTANQPQMTIGNNGNIGIGTGTAQPRAKVDIRSPDAAIELRNSNDQGRGGLIENTFGALQLGMFAERNGQGQVPATGKRAFFGFDTGGRVGSLINSLNTPSAPAFRNLLDDGQGNAVITGNLSVGHLTVANLPAMKSQINDYPQQLQYPKGESPTLITLEVNVPSAGQIKVTGWLQGFFVDQGPGNGAFRLKIDDGTVEPASLLDSDLAHATANRLQTLWAGTVSAGVRRYKLVFHNDTVNDAGHFINRAGLIVEFVPNSL